MSKKVITVIGIVTLIIGLLFVLKLINENNQDYIVKDITVDEYQTYNKYGINNGSEEEKVFELLKHNLNLEEFELVVETENLVMYKCTTNENIQIIKSLLVESKEVKELLYVKENPESEIVNFSIDYINENNQRIILVYTNSNIVLKTFKERNSIVHISSELTKEIYRD